MAFYGLAAVAVTTAVLVVVMRPAAYSALAGQKGYYRYCAYLNLFIF